MLMAWPPMGGSPALTAAEGSAPTRAIAGDGQITHATIMITNPITQKATAGVS
jgi:hypothetical protein